MRYHQVNGILQNKVEQLWFRTPRWEDFPRGGKKAKDIFRALMADRNTQHDLIGNRCWKIHIWLIMTSVFSLFIIKARDCIFINTFNFKKLNEEENTFEKKLQRVIWKYLSILIILQLFECFKNRFLLNLMKRKINGP